MVAWLLLLIGIAAGGGQSAGAEAHAAAAVANGPAGPYGYSAGTAGWQYLHHDALGSVSDVTNATGAAQWRYAYEPFGGLAAGPVPCRGLCVWEPR